MFYYINFKVLSNKQFYRYIFLQEKILGLLFLVIIFANRFLLIFVNFYISNIMNFWLYKANR